MYRSWTVVSIYFMGFTAPLQGDSVGLLLVLLLACAPLFYLYYGLVKQFKRKSSKVTAEFPIIRVQPRFLQKLQASRVFVRLAINHTNDPCLVNQLLHCWQGDRVM